MPCRPIATLPPSQCSLLLVCTVCLRMFSGQLKAMSPTVYQAVGLMCGGE